MPGIEKLLRGILKYRQVDRAKWVKRFERLREKPETSAVVFTCMDSRVLSSKFTNSDVGNNFIVRNAGNLIPCAHDFNYNTATTEAGALELGCVRNNIRHVVLCGHSDCKAMGLLYDLRHECTNVQGTPLELWVKKHGLPSVEKFNTLSEENNFAGPLTFQMETPERTFKAYIDPENKYNILDKFSQVSCLQQLEHIAAYPFLKDKLSTDQVRLHALWFDIYSGNVFMFSREQERFLEINEETVNHLLKDADSPV